uniref:Uncharacterized protein n=1 Tax=viral metagenome TaxID=1070528 RepID=A0A6M3LQC6_9ZZZZ
MTGSDLYIAANGAVLILVLRQLLEIERRLGACDSVIEKLKKYCKLFNPEIKPGKEH